MSQTLPQCITTAPCVCAYVSVWASATNSRCNSLQSPSALSCFIAMLRRTADHRALAAVSGSQQPPPPPPPSPFIIVIELCSQYVISLIRCCLMTRDAHHCFMRSSFIATSRGSACLEVTYQKASVSRANRTLSEMKASVYIRLIEQWS